MVVLSLLPGTSNGQGDDELRSAARDAADVDCRRKLVETVKGLRIRTDAFVGDFVAESEMIEAELTAFARSVRVSEPAYLADGSCQIAVEVPVQQVVDVLKELHARYYRGDWIRSDDFNSIPPKLGRAMLKVVGRGVFAGRGAPTISTSGGPVASIQATPYPALWQGIAPQARLMAAEAARKDAQRKLLERILGLRVNSTTVVRDYVTTYDQITTRGEGLIAGAEEIRRTYRPDETVVEVTLSVSPEQAMRTIQELRSRRHGTLSPDGSDAAPVSEQVVRRSLEATGCGVPPQNPAARGADAAGAPLPPTPEWVSARFRASGQATDAEMGTAQGRLRALAAATQDARSKLSAQIFALTLPEGARLGDFVAERDEVRSQVLSLIAGAIIEDRRLEGDAAQVLVSVGGPELWTVVHGEMMIEAPR